MVIFFSGLLKEFHHTIFLDNRKIGEIDGEKDVCITQITNDSCNLTVNSEQCDTNKIISSLLGFIITNNPYIDFDIYNYKLSFFISGIETDKSIIKIKFSDYNKNDCFDKSNFDVIGEKCSILNVKTVCSINQEKSEKHFQRLRKVQNWYLLVILCITSLLLMVGIIKGSFVLASLCITIGTVFCIFFLIGRKKLKKIYKNYQELILK